MPLITLWNSASNCPAADQSGCRVYPQARPAGDRPINPCFYPLFLLRACEWLLVGKKINSLGTGTPVSQSECRRKKLPPNPLRFAPFSLSADLWPSICPLSICATICATLTPPNEAPLTRHDDPSSEPAQRFGEVLDHMRHDVISNEDVDLLNTCANLSPEEKAEYTDALCL